MSPHLALAAICALDLAGCGGSEESAVRATVKAYGQAFTDGDAAKACALLTRDARRVIEAAGDGSCVAVLQPGLSAEDMAGRRAFGQITVESVHVDGDTATVKAKDRDGTIRLRKEAGRWRIARSSSGDTLRIS
jgi:hypothetical protein